MAEAVPVPEEWEAFDWAEGNEEGDAGRLLLQLSARVRIPVIALAHRPTRVFLAAPGGLLPISRFRARVGPLFRRTPMNVSLYSEALSPLTDAEGEALDVPLDIVEASPTLLRSCAPLESDAFLAEHPGFWPATSDLLDGIAGLLAQHDALPFGPPPAAGPLLPEGAPNTPAYPPLQGSDPAGPGLLGLDPGFLSQLLELQRAVESGRSVLPPQTPLASPFTPPAVKATVPSKPPGLGGVRHSAPASAAARASGAPPPAPSAVGESVFSNLDSAVVADARAAGILESDLAVFDRVLAAGKRRPPDPVTSRAPEVAEVGGDPPPPVDRLDRLIDTLSSVFADRATSARPVIADPVERALGYMDAPSGADPSSGRRGASARLALRRALAENPEHFSRYVEGQLASAFASRAATGERPTMREYLELRSRVGNHRPTVSWLWAIAGARDALASGRNTEALARLDLAVVAGEQVSIDGGHWLLGQELMWEDDPPFHSFAGHRPADPGRSARSHLCDPRWAEAALSRLKELDEWNERRRRLGGIIRPSPSPHDAGAPPAGGTTDAVGVNPKARPKRRPGPEPPHQQP